MNASLRRIQALWLRYALLHRRSLVRAFDIVFWPVLDLLVWSFVTRYLQQVIPPTRPKVALFFIGALIGWDIHYRGQQAVTISLMEEIWTRNLVNLLIAPVRLWEWVCASFLYGATKILLVATLLSIIAKLLVSFDVLAISGAFIPLAASLLFFGWSIGLVTAGILLRYGYAAEALIWGIPFLLQPFSCVFYPVHSLPAWARPIALALPTTHAFEALRVAMRGEAVQASSWLWIVGLNAVYFALALALFVRMFRRARMGGHLGRLGQD